MWPIKKLCSYDLRSKVGHTTIFNFIISSTHYISRSGNFYRWIDQFARRKFSPPALIGQNFITLNFCPFIKDCIEDMATFTMLVKFYSTKYFCNTKVAGLGEIFIQRKTHIYNNYGTVTLIWVHTFFPVLLLVVGHVQSCIQPRSTQCHNASLGLFVSSRSSHLFPGRCL